MGVYMRKILISSAAISIGLMLSVPAHALGMGDLAKVVLGGSSVLKKGEEKCGSSLGLTKDESLAITFARAAAEQALPLSQFTYLDKSADDEAASVATTPTFCNETKAKKSGMMNAIKKAGAAILKRKALGGLGI